MKRGSFSQVLWLAVSVGAGLCLLWLSVTAQLARASADSHSTWQGGRTQLSNDEAHDGEPLADSQLEEPNGPTPIAVNLATLYARWRTQPKPEFSAVVTRQAGATQSAAALADLWVDGAAAAGGNGSAGQPFTRIQDGINAAVAGQQVLVRSGVYAEALALKAGVTVASEHSTSVVVIRSSASPVVLCADQAVLKNLSINSTHVAPTHVVVQCSGGAPILNGVVISRTDGVAGFPIRLINTIDALIYNSAVIGYGGDSEVTVECGSISILYSFVASRVRWGGCAAAQAVTALYDSTVFGGDTLFAASADQNDPPQVQLFNNWLVNAGVGFVDGPLATQQAAALVVNNTIVGASNSAIRSSGNQWQVDVINNLLAHNQYGLYNESGAANFRVVDNNLFWSNQARVFGVADPVGARGNIQRNPYFVNAAIGDWHITANSGAVDTGQTVSAISYDFDGNRRPCDGNDNGRYAYDIGSDEYATSVKCATPAPTVTPTTTATPTKTPTPTATPSGTTVPTTASHVYLPLIALNPLATPTFIASATFIATATFVPTISHGALLTTPILVVADSH